MSTSRPQSIPAQTRAAHCQETLGTDPDRHSLALEWLCLLYRISRQINAKGLIVVEAFAAAPLDSPWLAEHPLISTGPELDFCCDILRLMAWGTLYEGKWRWGYIRDAQESYLTVGASPEILPAIGWFLMLINHAPEASAEAAWQQLPLAHRPDLDNLKARMKTIRQDQYDLDKDCHRERRQRIRHFVAGLTSNISAGEQK